MPTTDISGGPLLVLSLILVAGVLSGALIRRLGLPAVTGQILAGVGLVQLLPALFGEHVEAGLQPVTRFALGFITITVGAHLDVRRLRNAGRRLFLLLLTETTVTPVIVLLALRLLGGTTWTMAYLVAALAISTAPATIVAVVKESRARGVFVKTLIAAVALNNIACVCVFELAHSAARVALAQGGIANPSAVILAPLADLAGAALIGFGCGGLLVLTTRRVLRPDRLATSTLISLMFATGLSDWLGFSSMLSCLFLGVTLANLSPYKDEVIESAFSNIEDATLAAFFTIAGMHLDFGHLAQVGWLTTLVVSGRIVGKVLAARLALQLGGATRPVRRYLGLALVPQAGIAVGLMLVVQDDPAFASISQLFLTVGLTSVAINELLGPVLTRWALFQSGDAGKARPRLIDFLHEENIVTGFHADGYRPAVEQLADVLIQTNHLEIDRDALVEALVEREEHSSTCLGDGLAIPHVTIDGGGGIYGAMAISASGLPFETPDGKPVHCMVLLATPRTQRDRHLEVLAALARAIASDRNVRRQLYHAKSPAHAYDLLHAEEAEDFNYFLDDEEPVASLQREPIAVQP